MRNSIIPGGTGIYGLHSWCCAANSRSASFKAKGDKRKISLPFSPQMHKFSCWKLVINFLCWNLLKALRNQHCFILNRGLMVSSGLDRSEGEPNRQTGFITESWLWTDYMPTCTTNGTRPLDQTVGISIRAVHHCERFSFPRSLLWVSITKNTKKTNLGGNVPSSSTKMAIGCVLHRELRMLYTLRWPLPVFVLSHQRWSITALVDWGKKGSILMAGKLLSKDAYSDERVAKVGKMRWFSSQKPSIFSFKLLFV